eukprot:6226066-Prymnesium_polylepis.1
MHLPHLVEVACLARIPTAEARGGRRRRSRPTATGAEAAESIISCHELISRDWPVAGAQDRSSEKESERYTATHDGTYYLELPSRSEREYQ